MRGVGMLWLLCLLAMSCVESHVSPLYQETATINLLHSLESKMNALIETSESGNVKIDSIMHTTRGTDKRLRDLDYAQQHYEVCTTELTQIKIKLSQIESQFSDTKLELAETKIKLTNTLAELGDTKSKLSGANIKLSDIKAELSDTKTKLSDNNTELTDTNTELTDIKAKLIDMKTELNHTETKLLGTETELVDIKTELVNAETELAHTKTEFKNYRTILLNADYSRFKIGKEIFYSLWEQKSWEDARISCQAMGMDLAVPRNVVAVAKEYKNALMKRGINWFDAYIGAKQSSISSSWQWITGRSLTGSDNQAWRHGEPDGVGSNGNPLCTRISAYDGMMADGDCRNKDYFICEVPASLTG